MALIQTGDSIWTGDLIHSDLACTSSSIQTDDFTHIGNLIHTDDLIHTGG